MGKIGDLIYGSNSSKEKVEKLQLRIRDAEWKEIVDFIPNNCTFLDVGCGAGYALYKAKSDRSADVFGIDPAPFEHGVGRYDDSIFNKQTVQKAYAENIPFDAQKFDVVYSSHVLEHVSSETETLAEIKRVLKDDGTLILSMPTASMAFINWISQFLFTTHIKIYEFLTHVHKKEALKNFVAIFKIRSHSYPRAKSIFYDIFHYREKKWEKTINEHFEIEKKISPYLYPFPDYYQWFPFHRNKFFSSSVLFVCRKKKK